MNEEISKKIAEVDAAIYGAELSMSYYRGRVEAFEEARKLLAQPEMSGELKESEDAKAIADERKRRFHRTGLSIDVVKFEQKLGDIIHSWGIPQESPDNVPEQLHQDALALLDIVYKQLVESLPKWDFAKPGTKLPGASVIIYNEDPDPRMGTVAVEDCIYIPIADLNRLPLLEPKTTNARKEEGL